MLHQQQLQLYLENEIMYIGLNIYIDKLQVAGARFISMFIFNHVKYSAFGKLLTNVQFQCIFIINAGGEYFQL